MATFSPNPTMIYKKLIISAPGKVILFGEHSVVYGKNAIAASLDLRTTLEMEISGDNFVDLESEDLSLKDRWSIHDLDRIGLKSSDAGSVEYPTDQDVETFRKFLEIPIDAELHSKELARLVFIILYKGILQAENRKNLGFQIAIKSSLPVGAGLGSSASFAVCLSAALLALNNSITFTVSKDGPDPSVEVRQEDKELVNKWAFVAEKFIHGKPSGIDNTVCSFGGIIAFKKGEFRFLDCTTKTNLRIILVNTRVPRNTGKLVAKVHDRHTKHRDILDHILAAMELVAIKSEMVLVESSSASNQIMLGDLAEMNHGLLCALGAGHAVLDEVIAIARKHGFRAKMTGAGGGGCALIIVDKGCSESKIQALNDELVEHNFDVWRTTVGGVGLQLQAVV